MNIRSSYCLRVSIVTMSLVTADKSDPGIVLPSSGALQRANPARTKPKHGESFYFSSQTAVKALAPPGHQCSSGRTAIIRAIRQGRRMRAPDDQRIGIGRRSLSIEESCTAKGSAHQFAVLPGAGVRADNPAGCHWRAERSCQARGPGRGLRLPCPASPRWRGAGTAARRPASKPDCREGRAAAWRPDRPKISGLPGRMAIFQKSSAKPFGPSAVCTRS